MGESLKEEIIKYIEVLDKYSNLKIEFAILEPRLNSDQFNLHLLYTPKLNYLLETYVSGIVADAMTETCMPLLTAHTYLSGFIPTADRVKLSIVELPKIQNIIISNIAKFSNIKLQTSTEPFLAMFLEEKHIIWKTPEFNLFFFLKKNDYKPSKEVMLASLSLSFSELIKNSQEYSYINSQAKLDVLRDRLYNLVKLYYIVIEFVRTEELSSKLEEQYNLTLQTLQQATKPWDYARYCMENLNIMCKEKGVSLYPTPQITLSKELRQQVLNFLAYRITTETL